MMEDCHQWTNLFADGNAGKQIINILSQVHFIREDLICDQYIIMRQNVRNWNRENKVRNPK